MFCCRKRRNDREVEKYTVSYSRIYTHTHTEKVQTTIWICVLSSICSFLKRYWLLLVTSMAGWLVLKIIKPQNQQPTIESGKFTHPTNFIYIIHFRRHISFDSCSAINNLLSPIHVHLAETSIQTTRK